MLASCAATTLIHPCPQSCSEGLTRRYVWETPPGSPKMAQNLRCLARNSPKPRRGCGESWKLWGMRRAPSPPQPPTFCGFQHHCLIGLGEGAHWGPSSPGQNTSRADVGGSNSGEMILWNALECLATCFLAPLESTLTQPGPRKLPKSLANGAFRDQKNQARGVKAFFFKSGPRALGTAE